MREIKFRFYSKDAGQYAQVKSVDFGGDFFTVRYLGKNHHINGIGQLEQFTGLYDKNGKEIYEGDIVRDYDEGFLYKVVFCEYHAQFMFYDYLNDDYYDNQDIAEHEIIGNIHDNPELLEVTK